MSREILYGGFVNVGLLESCLRTIEGSTEVTPYQYQVETARHLFAGNNVLLRVPTGCGKTWSAVIPFLLSDQWDSPPTKLIYVLPLRTLIDSVASLLRDRLVRLDGWKPEDIKIQTGEKSEDPFLIEGRIIVTTFDQVLSGLMGDPYSLGPSLHNINSAAIEGALVVFDEFHLMPPDKAFLTAVAALVFFRSLCQSMWMTATATESLCSLLTSHLNAVDVKLPDSDRDKISALQCEKSLLVHEDPLTVDDVLKLDGRRLVVVNQVGRAQWLYRELKKKVMGIPLLCLHSRFFPSDRDNLRKQVVELLGKDSNCKEAVVVATQVVEAGLDITCDHLLTELAPANSIIQRAGRCARYGGTGTVHVFPLPKEDRNWLPYGTLQGPDPELEATLEALMAVHELDFESAADLVNRVHRERDLAAVSQGVEERHRRITGLIVNNNFKKIREGVLSYIREADLSVRLVVEDSDLFTPNEREGIRIDLNVLRGFAKKHPAAKICAWTYDDEGNGFWKDVDSQDLSSFYHFLVSTRYANYGVDYGLVLGEPGSCLSPPASPPEWPGYGPIGREYWADHVRKTADYVIQLVSRLIGPKNSILAKGLEKRYGLACDEFIHAMEMLALVHDLGKLQTGWQRWAEAVERAVQPDYSDNRPLAHTSSTQQVQFAKPRHALQGAYLAYLLIKNMDNPREKELILPIVAAVAAHHGGWVYPDAKIQPLCTAATQEINRVFDRLPADWKLSEFADFAEEVDKCTANPDSIQKHWPLTSLFIRLLRLSDQEATKEGGLND